ncbi:hypothetical protein ACWEQA_12960 [Nocardia sp. NPDC004085]
MGSIGEPESLDGNGQSKELEFPSVTGYHYRPDTYPPRPVWVRLDALLLRDPEMPRHTNGVGMEMHGETAGTLTHWIPTVDGDWLGRVTYTVCYADGRAPLRMRDQLVPAYALRPRGID